MTSFVQRNCLVLFFNFLARSCCCNSHYPPLESQDPYPTPLPLYAFLLTTIMVVWWQGMKRDKECKLFSVLGFFYLKSLSLLQVFWGSFCFSFYYGYKAPVHFFHASTFSSLEFWRGSWALAIVYSFCCTFLSGFFSSRFEPRSELSESVLKGGGYSFFFLGVFSSQFTLTLLSLL